MRTIDERQRGAQHARVDRARRGVDLDHIVEHDAIQVAGECERGAHLVESANLELNIERGTSGKGNDSDGSINHQPTRESETMKRRKQGMWIAWNSKRVVKIANKSCTAPCAWNANDI